QRVKEDEDDASSKKAAVPNNNNSIRVNLDKIDLLMNKVMPETLGHALGTAGGQQNSIEFHGVSPLFLRR
ncbi:MAG: hypothetical protein PHI55_08895, partial [Burkholderiaceae bacterium]|nr:hypothetical protein [Burkholderiaceae bacterium]